MFIYEDDDRFKICDLLRFYKISRLEFFPHRHSYGKLQGRGRNDSGVYQGREQAVRF